MLLPGFRNIHPSSLARPVALFLLAAGLCCSDDTQQAGDAGPLADIAPAGDLLTLPNLPGGNPLVPQYATLPFPSDFYLVADKTTATGYRVKIPQAALPKPIPATMFDKADGFARLPLVLAFLPGGIDPKSLPSPDDPSVTVTDASPVLLLKSGTWEKVPTLVEIDMMAGDDKSRALMLRPLVLLDEKSQYVVLVRNKLLRLDGTAHQANAAMQALLSGTRTADAALEQQREDFKQVTAAIAALQLDPKEVVLGWTFRTRSEKQVVGTLVAMQEAMNKAPLASFSITSDKSETSGAKTNRQIVASIKVPNFVKDGKISFDSAGKPQQQGTRDATFGLTIPSTVDGPRPVILYGHGFLGGWNQGTRGTWNDIATKYRYNTAATHMGFHENIETMVTQAISLNLGRLSEVVAEVQQSLANVTMLGRLVREKLATQITTKDKNGMTVQLFDDKQIYYHGISNGGTFGYVVAATSPVVQRASIIVGGGGLTHFLQRAVQWDEYSKFIKLLYPKAPDQQLLMALIQITLDPVDSINYAPYLISKRFTGLKPIPVALHMAVNDSQVNNLVTEWVARSAKIPLITPSPKKIYGLKTITAAAPGGAPAGTLGAMFVYDEKVTPSPKTNVPPKTDNKTHGTVRKLSVYQTHVTTFLEQGTFVQVCKGACDPE